MPDPTALLTSVWLYPALFGLAIADAFLFLVPSEVLLLAAAAAAAADGPQILTIALTAATGAIIGDHIAYQLGRSSSRALAGRRSARAAERATVRRRAGDLIQRKGGLILIGARYVPGGRTAVTFAAGSVDFGRSRFLAFDVLASGLWAAFYATAGLVGGTAFSNVWIGCGVGVAMAVTIGGLIRLTQLVGHRGAHS